MFCQERVLKNFTKCPGKEDLWQNLFLIQLSRSSARNFIKKQTLVQLFSFDLCEMFQKMFFTDVKCFRKYFLQKTFGQLLLKEHWILLLTAPIAILNNISKSSFRGFVLSPN